MIVQVRTRADLVEILKIGLSAAWKVSKESIRRQGTTRVHVVNWDGNLRIEGDYLEERSFIGQPPHPPGRTVIAFGEGCIRLCKVEFKSQQPVTYHDLSYEQATRAEPTYEPINGVWPPQIFDDD